jgi:hypothetical protein
LVDSEVAQVGGFNIPHWRDAAAQQATYNESDFDIYNTKGDIP